DICTTGGNLSGYTTQVTNIVINNQAGLGVMPSTVVVNSVTPSLTCYTGTYRNGPVPVATVSANITIQYPMGFIFDWFGDAVGQATTVVADDARIFGQ
ncbi:pilus assembly protein, partial [Escherichia coli]|nr:pilus assembly protein [Escherichia coli]